VRNERNEHTYVRERSFHAAADVPRCTGSTDRGDRNGGGADGGGGGGGGGGGSSGGGGGGGDGGGDGGGGGSNGGCADSGGGGGDCGGGARFAHKPRAHIFVVRPNLQTLFLLRDSPFISHCPLPLFLSFDVPLAASYVHVVPFAMISSPLLLNRVHRENAECLQSTAEEIVAVSSCFDKERRRAFAITSTRT